MIFKIFEWAGGDLLTQKTNNFTYSRTNRVYILLIGNVFINAPHLWNELRNMMLISTLFILYLVLLGPYLVRGKVDQIRQVIS